MSDNRTTELLPCPMCGAAWPSVQVRWIGFTHTHNGAFSAGYRGECCDCGLTTRAFNDEAEAIAAWNTRAAHGTLTAEQVEKAIHDCSTYASYDGVQYYANGIMLQAIADELNAELGSGTCENTQHDADFMCSVCGKCVDNGRILGFNYCPNCGRQVKR